MKWASTASLVLVAVLTQAVAGDAAKDTSKSSQEKPQASIPFIDLPSSIITWQADGRQGLWLQDVRKQWYYAQMFSPCDGLEFTVTLGIKTRTMNTLDRYSDIIVPGGATGHCALKSLTKSDPPPKGKHHGASGDKSSDAK